VLRYNERNKTLTSLLDDLVLDLDGSVEGDDVGLVINEESDESSQKWLLKHVHDSGADGK
jgi:hypothetical protein